MIDTEVPDGPRPLSSPSGSQLIVESELLPRVGSQHTQLDRRCRGAAHLSDQSTNGKMQISLREGSGSAFPSRAGLRVSLICSLLHDSRYGIGHRLSQISSRQVDIARDPRDHGGSSFALPASVGTGARVSFFSKT